MVQYIENPNQQVERPSGLTWANDVMFVYANLSAKVEHGTVPHGQYALHRWASDEKNIDKFLTTMVPKATDMLQKAKSRESESDESVKLEHRAISELQALLDQAIDESGKL